MQLCTEMLHHIKCGILEKYDFPSLLIDPIKYTKWKCITPVLSQHSTFLCIFYVKILTF